MKPFIQTIDIQVGVKDDTPHLTLFVSKNNTNLCRDKFLYTVVRNADMQVLCVSPRPHPFDVCAETHGLVVGEDFPIWAL